MISYPAPSCLQYPTEYRTNEGNSDKATKPQPAQQGFVSLARGFIHRALSVGPIHRTPLTTGYPPGLSSPTDIPSLPHP